MYRKVEILLHWYYQNYISNMKEVKISYVMEKNMVNIP
jgi:hypothetical protein